MAGEDFESETSGPSGQFSSVLESSLAERVATWRRGGLAAGLRADEICPAVPSLRPGGLVGPGPGIRTAL